MRLGDLDALKEDLKQYFSDGTLDSVSAKLAFNMILRKIDNATTVEERSQGEWLLLRTNYEDSGNNFYECSNCHYTDVHADSVEVPFCWHCGSRMKGGAEWQE